MIRLLGAITGSALALATLLVVIGIPQFKTEATTSENAIVTLPLPTSPVDRNGETAPTPALDSADTITESNVAAAASTNVEDPLRPADDAAIAAEHQSVAESSAEPGEPMIPPGIDAQAVLDTPQSWYAFWSPFRSELAANGFVAQLQSVTGLDYRVVRVKPGVYEVAFAYEDDADITANLTQITAATGLELPQ